MPVVWNEQGLIGVLQSYVQSETLIVWPFKNDRMPSSTDSISLYTEADFSGYDGAIPLGLWGTPYLSNGRCFIKPSPVGWLHNGGPSDNFIYGVVCVDGLGNLVFAERDPRAPVLINLNNPSYNYQPVISDAVEFPG